MNIWRRIQIDGEEIKGCGEMIPRYRFEDHQRDICTAVMIPCTMCSLSYNRGSQDDHDTTYTTLHVTLMKMELDSMKAEVRQLQQQNRELQMALAKKS